MSGIPPNAPWRGCASSFPLPVDQEAVQHAEIWARDLELYNPDDNIVHRPGDGDYDITHHVLRWNTTMPGEVFQNGFRARPQGDTSSNVYYSLYHHVHNGGVPLNPNRPVPHIFVSTTLSRRWRPSVDRRTEVYRYEIYAPGGILVAQTLGRERYGRHFTQDEVAFVGGIAPQYIRSAQRFTPIDDPRDRSRRIWEPADVQLIINLNFNPRFLEIQRPIVDYWDPLLNKTMPLPIIYHEPPHAERRKREVSTPTDSNTIHWYAEDVANSKSYINAAFRSSYENEAYLFMKSEYVRVNYAPGTTKDKVLYGPVPISDTFPSLRGTAFGEYGIDCAFRSHDKNQAFIFSGNLCALINYRPHTSTDEIIKGPMTIAKMFPYLKGTVFESGIDAAFESTRSYEAYLFKGDKYGLIKYGSKHSGLIGWIGPISGGYHSLKGTMFESGIDAAFASCRKHEAYIFKGDSYALIEFAPRSSHDYIIGGPKKILPDNWPSLRCILPRNNRGLDVHDYTTTS